MKKGLSKINKKIKDALWTIRNGYYKIKKNIGAALKKGFDFITLKNKREQKQQLREKQLRDVLNINDETISLHHDVDLVSIKEEKLNELNQKKQQLKTVTPEEKLSLQHEIKELEQIISLFPLSKKQVAKREKVKKELSSFAKGALYLSPVLILLVVFSFYPIVNAVRLSFLDGYNEVTGETQGFAWFKNFAAVLSDENFIFPAAHTKSSALINTLMIVIFTVPISIGIALLIAVLLNSIKPLQKLFQTIFFLPYVTNSLAVGLVFSYMFRTDGGLINQMLSSFGIQGGAWVGQGASYGKAIFVLLLFEVWNSLAFKILVFMSAIQGIDKQYYQAALIDATPKFKQFRRITVPLISPTVLYIVITSIIGSFKTYSSVIAIFGNTGQPPGANYNLKTVVFYIYDFFGTSGKFPHAAAASVLLFLLLLVLTLIQMRVSKKRVHY